VGESDASGFLWVDLKDRGSRDGLWQYLHVLGMGSFKRPYAGAFFEPSHDLVLRPEGVCARLAAAVVNFFEKVNKVNLTIQF